MTGWNQADVDYLARLGDTARQVDADTREQVRRLRESGCPWSVIGEALGITRQSAWERFKSTTSEEPSS